MQQRTHWASKGQQLQQQQQQQMHMGLHTQRTSSRDNSLKPDGLLPTAMPHRHPSQHAAPATVAA
jgi:hypothetical protein